MYLVLELLYLPFQTVYSPEPNMLCSYVVVNLHKMQLKEYFIACIYRMQYATIVDPGCLLK